MILKKCPYCGKFLVVEINETQPRSKRTGGSESPNLTDTPIPINVLEGSFIPSSNDTRIVYKCPDPKCGYLLTD